MDYSAFCTSRLQAMITFDQLYLVHPKQRQFRRERQGISKARMFPLPIDSGLSDQKEQEWRGKVKQAAQHAQQQARAAAAALAPVYNLNPADIAWGEGATRHTALVIACQESLRARTATVRKVACMAWRFIPVWCHSSCSSSRL